MKLSYVIVVTMLMTMLSGCGNSQDKTVIGYCKALDAGNLEEAASFLSKDAMRVLEGAGGKSLLAEAGGKFRQRKGIREIKIIGKKVVGESTLVAFEYDFKDGSRVADSFPLIKEDGAWKINK